MPISASDPAQRADVAHITRDMAREHAHLVTDCAPSDS
jgi:hypothetical protein